MNKCVCVLEVRVCACSARVCVCVRVCACILVLVHANACGSECTQVGILEEVRECIFMLERCVLMFSHVNKIEEE